MSPETNEPVSIERTHQEVRKLLAGVEYDAAVINARDPLSRRVVLASLLTVLAGRNREQRGRARKAFLAHGFLEETARDLQTADSAPERAAAARKLGVVADFSATPHLASGLHDTAPEVRRACVESLGQIGDGAGISPLTDLLACETNRLVPEAAIRHAINSITVAEAKRASMADKPALKIVDEAPSGLSVPNNEIKAAKPTEPIPAVPSVPTPAPSSPSSSQNSMRAQESRLHQGEHALRQAAETLARKRLEAEAARQKAEEETRQTKMRVEEEWRRRAEDEAHKSSEPKLKARLEEDGLLKMAEESPLKAAPKNVEPEADFRVEAELLRRAAEELSRKRAEAITARKL